MLLGTKKKLNSNQVTPTELPVVHLSTLNQIWHMETTHLHATHHTIYTNCMNNTTQITSHLLANVYKSRRETSQYNESDR